MKKLVSAKVTIDVPLEEYELLKIIKDETGQSIRSLVSEGVPIVILSNEDVLKTVADTAGQKAEMIRSSITTLKKESSE
ncbi:hypothetical protein [Methanobacterium ferruginis]|uniref:hypothetical protein n=1 Tax=Methanobacterium ferruginis TaxID=710191 RepID=UPI002573E78F|nr:hypothetical protein [Methanobacterium ferruginis]BDZ68558.1 hypothetical protein GCM10025860_20060 [Methanobacterium ferruginis]